MSKISQIAKFKSLKNPTYKQCLKAVKHCGLLLEFIDNQTEDLCLEAVKQDGNALEFVKNKTLLVMKEAIKQNSLSLIHTPYFESLNKHEDFSSLVKDTLELLSNKILIKKTISELKE